MGRSSCLELKPLYTTQFNYLQYKQIKARERHGNDENANVFDYSLFEKSIVKQLTDAFFGDIPEVDDNITAIKLMHLLLFEGQASKGISFSMF